MLPAEGSLWRLLCPAGLTQDLISLSVTGAGCVPFCGGDSFNGNTLVLSQTWGVGVGGLGGYSHLSAWLVTVNHLEGTVLCQVAFCESWLWFGPLLINPIDINWAPSVLQAWV